MAELGRTNLTLHTVAKTLEREYKDNFSVCNWPKFGRALLLYYTNLQNLKHLPSLWISKSVLLEQQQT